MAHGAERMGRGAQSRAIYSRIFCLLTSVLWCRVAGYELRDSIAQRVDYGDIVDCVIEFYEVE